MAFAKDHRSALGAAAAAGLAAHVLPALAPLAPPLAGALGIRTRLDRPEVLLTFDDGPHPQGTPAVLQQLEREQVRAAFFLVGEQVRRYGGLAAEIAAAGHAVELHGDRHRNQLRLTPAQIREDLRRGADSICSAAGARPRRFRPPFGIFSAAGLAVIRSCGWRPLLWSRWGCDWTARAGAGSVAALATRELRGGEIILLHDADHYGAPGCWRATTTALPRVIEAIRAAGLRLASGTV